MSNELSKAIQLQASISFLIDLRGELLDRWIGQLKEQGLSPEEFVKMVVETVNDRLLQIEIAIRWFERCPRSVAVMVFDKIAGEIDKNS